MEKTFLSVVAFGALSPVVLFADPVYTSTLIGGGNPSSVNDSDEVVYYASPAFNGQGGLLWKNGTVKPIGDDPIDTFPYAVSDTGMITGYRVEEHGGVEVDRAFTFDNGRFRDLKTPALIGENTEGFDINRNNIVAGAIWNDLSSTQAVLWKNGKIIILPSLPGALSSEAVALNDSNVAVGYTIEANGSHATVWKNGRAFDLGLGSIADINDRGVMIGLSSIAGTSPEAVMWKGKKVTAFPLLPDGSSFVPNALNDENEVVGSSTGFGFGEVYTHGDYTVLAADQVFGTIRSGNDVNDEGDIVGVSTGLSGDRAWLFTPESPAPVPAEDMDFIPEPGFLGFVSASMILFTRRRSRV